MCFGKSPGPPWGWLLAGALPKSTTQQIRAHGGRKEECTRCGKKGRKLKGSGKSYKESKPQPREKRESVKNVKILTFTKPESQNLIREKDYAKNNGNIDKEKPVGATL